MHAMNFNGIHFFRQTPDGPLFSSFADWRQGPEQWALVLSRNEEQLICQTKMALEYALSLEHHLLTEQEARATDPAFVQETYQHYRQRLREGLLGLLGSGFDPTHLPDARHFAAPQLTYLEAAELQVFIHETAQEMGAREDNLQKAERWQQLAVVADLYLALCRSDLFLWAKTAILPAVLPEMPEAEHAPLIHLFEHIEHAPWIWDHFLEIALRPHHHLRIASPPKENAQ
jgi:hypothetical protein